jgi:hypothetical protein
VDDLDIGFPEVVSLANRKGGNPVTKEQRLLVNPLKKFLKNQGKSSPLTEFKIKGGWIDVINYNKNDRVFDIVECKIAENPVRIGQAFGQLMAYHGIIQENGRRFFKGVLERARDWITFEEQAKIFVEKKAKIRLYACFAEEGVRDHQRLLSTLTKETKSRIGLILIQRGNVAIIQNAAVRTVSIKAYYNKQEFYDKLREDIKERFPTIRETGHRYPNVARFNFVHPSIHFEAWIKRRRSAKVPIEIEIGLHLECNTYRDEYIFEELRRRKQRIRRRLPGAKFGKWGRKVNWYRVYERYSYNGDINRIDEKVLEIVKNRLLNYIKTLKPILVDIDWGRRRTRKPR